jgi:creatinine amidohydrolase
LLLLFATYWSLGARPWEQDSSLVQREMGHACEWETSMILRLDPSLVGDYRNTQPFYMSQSFSPAARGWTTNDRSAPGHIGQPHLATAEKGESLFRIFAEDLLGFLHRVIAWDGASW